MRYIGFDLGDGESAVAAYEQGSGIEPVILPVAGARSLLSAVGLLNGEIVVGERAYTDALADRLSVRFKSRFSTDPASHDDLVLFARGVLADLYQSGSAGPDDCFVVGCPAGWSAASRARYRELLQSAGVPLPQVISESRAAFLYAKYARTVALDVDVINQCALVVDIGSSTLDFAYIVDGRETGVGTFGENNLGGGLLDAALLRRAVERSPQRDLLRRVLAHSRSWHSYLEIQARRVKEEYFSRLHDEPAPVVRRQVRVCYDGVQRLTLTLDPQEAETLMQEPLEELDGRSFVSALKEALAQAARLTSDEPPRLVLITGGASRMPLFRELCQEAFEAAVVVSCPEPEFSIAKGLAYAGWIDENLRAFRAAVREEITDARVGGVARRALNQLLPGVADALAGLLMEEAVAPLTQAWKRGAIGTLGELNDRLAQRMRQVLASPLAERVLAPVIAEWLKGMDEELQELVNPICDRYDVPRREMKLNLAAGASALAPSVQGVVSLSPLGAALGAMVSVVTAVLCGGGGVALIAAGPVGMLAGLVLGAAASALGWGPVNAALMRMHVPLLLRHGLLEKRLMGDAVRARIREALRRELQGENGPFQTQLVEGFSKAFRAYVYSVAQAAEIPIG